jgi:hypothetical protein
MSASATSAKHLGRIDDREQIVDLEREQAPQPRQVFPATQVVEDFQPSGAQGHQEDGAVVEGEVQGQVKITETKKAMNMRSGERAA